MTLGIESAPLAVNAARQAGAISLSSFSALPGFASLFSGLLDQNASLIVQTPAGRQRDPARDAILCPKLRNPNVSSQRAAENGDATVFATKPQQRKTGTPSSLHKEAILRPGGAQTLLQIAAGEQTASPPLGEARGQDMSSNLSGPPWTSIAATPSTPLPGGRSALLPGSSAWAVSAAMSLPKASVDNARSAGDLAFALRLSWQPSFVRPGITSPSLSAEGASSPAQEASHFIASDPSAGSPIAPIASISGDSRNGAGTDGVWTTGAGPTRDAGDRTPVNAPSYVLQRFYGGAPPQEPLLALAGTQAGGVAQATRSTGPGIPGREEPASQTRVEALRGFSSASFNSPPETDAFATSAGASVEVQASKRFSDRVAEKVIARTGDRTLEQNPAETASQPPPEKSVTSSSPLGLKGDVQPSKARGLSFSDTQASQPATGASYGGSDSATPGDREDKSGAKGVGDVAAQRPLSATGTHENPGPSVNGILLGTSANQGDAVRGSTKALAPPMAQAHAAGTTEASPAPAATSIREVSIRLEAATSAPVDVQLASKAGKVQVAVRTPDLDLAKSLQTNLGELVGRLEDKGFKTEAWTPQTTVHAGVAVRQAATSTANSGHSDQSGCPGGQPDGRGGQKQSGHRQQGRWETELEEKLSAPSAALPAGD